jgi:hypothetical protein
MKLTEKIELPSEIKKAFPQCHRCEKDRLFNAYLSIIENGVDKDNHKKIISSISEITCYDFASSVDQDIYQSFFELQFSSQSHELIENIDDELWAEILKEDSKLKFDLKLTFKNVEEIRKKAYELYYKKNKGSGNNNTNDTGGNVSPIDIPIEINISSFIDVLKPIFEADKLSLFEYLSLCYILNLDHVQNPAQNGHLFLLKADSIS